MCRKVQREEAEKCTTKNGMISPCFGLDQIIEGDVPNRRVAMLSLTNMETMQVARQHVVSYSGQHRKNGIVFNYCPFCGKNMNLAYAAGAASVKKGNKK